MRLSMSCPRVVRDVTIPAAARLEFIQIHTTYTVLYVRRQSVWVHTLSTVPSVELEGHKKVEGQCSEVADVRFTKQVSLTEVCTR